MNIFYFLYINFFKIFKSKEYESLSPISNIKNSPTLNKLKNDMRDTENNNIALSGKYGAGKSSIIKSFFKGFRRLVYKPLYISLGMLGIKENDKDLDVNEFCQEIEKSIIQQIIYKEKASKVPESNIKRVSKLRKRNILTVFLVIIFLITIKYIALYLNIGLNELIINILEIISQFRIRYKILIAFVTVILLLSISIKIAKFLKRIDIKNIKFNFTNTEIEVEKSSSESLINKYMDELVYFFSVTKYNVVIIEDLDRFLEIEKMREKILIIFQKLKELNQILNSSKQVRKRIVFVYVVKDSLFEDEKERTKFFESIVPVIPVISDYNSYAELREKFKDENINDKLLQDISPYINDYRVIKNIKNEYELYKKEINGDGILKEKQLAIITLKNLRPKNFDELLNNEGKIFDLISSKENIIENKEKSIHGNIKINNEKINELKNENINSLNELKRLIISGLALKRSYRSISSAYGFDQFLQDSFDLERIKNSNIILENRNGDAFREEDVFEYFGGKNNFINRAERVQSNRENEIKRYLNNNTKLNEKIEELHSKPLYELLEDNDINKLNDKFIEMLLKNGYVDDSYQNYMFRYKETDDINKNDYSFIVNVRQYKASKFDYPIENVNKVIDELNENYFSIEEILNYKILDKLLNSDSNEFTNKKNNFIKMLAKTNENKHKFIIGFVNNYTDSARKMINELYRKNENVIYDILIDNTNNEIIKDNFIKFIINCPEILNNVAANQYIKQYIENKNDFETWIRLNNDVKKSLCKLDIKFKKLDEQKENGLLKFIYENNLYEINSDMLRLVFKYNGKTDDEFEEKNLSIVMSDESLSKLKEYINNNKQKYIDNCYLENINNRNNIMNIIDCINNWNISLESKNSMIKKIEKKVIDIRDVNSEYYNKFVENDKMDSNWSNYFYVYCANGEEITKEMVKNIEDNISTISEIKDIDIKQEEVENLMRFKEKIVKNNEINIEVYKVLLNKINIKIKSIATNEIESDRLKLLVDKNMVEITKNNLITIYEQQINLLDKFVNNNIDIFISNIDSFELNQKMIHKIVESLLIPNRYKTKIINLVDNELINSSSMKYIIKNYSQNKISKINDDLKNKIFTSNIEINYKLELLEKEIDKNITKDKICSYISLLPEPYKNIGNNKKKIVVFNNNDRNNRILNKLKNKGFNLKTDERVKKVLVYNLRK